MITAGYGKGRGLTLTRLFVTSYVLALTIASLRCKKSGGVKTPPASEIDDVPRSRRIERWIRNEHINAPTVI